MAAEVGLCCLGVIRSIIPIVMIVIGTQNLPPKDLGDQDLGHKNVSVSEPT